MRTGLGVILGEFFDKGKSEMSNLNELENLFDENRELLEELEIYMTKVSQHYLLSDQEKEELIGKLEAQREKNTFVQDSLESQIKDEKGLLI